MGDFLERRNYKSSVCKNRKKQWLLDSLHENWMDVSKSSKLVDVVVNVMPHWKLDFILEYLKYNQNVEDFKKMMNAEEILRRTKERLS